MQGNGFHLMVEVVVFGQSYNMVVDTGASATVLDKSIVELHLAEVDILPSEHLSTGLGVSDMASFAINVQQLAIGSLELHDISVAVLDLSTIRQAYESLELPSFIGVLGGDILQKHKAVISYKKNTITFSS